MCNDTAVIIWTNLTVTILSQLSENDTTTLNEIKFWVDGVIGTTIATLGIPINSLTIFILRTKPSLKHVSTGLVCSLLVADTLFLACKIMNNLYWDFNIASLGPLVGYVLIPLEKTFLTMTIFITVGIAHQGSAMAKDFEGYERISSHQRSRRLKILSYILPVVVASLVINIPLFFGYQCVDGMVIDTEVRRNFHFIVLYNNFVRNILTVFAPITLLIFYNWNIYIFIREKYKEIEEWDMDEAVRKQNKMHAKILFIIILMFIICHSPRCFLKFYRGFYEPYWIKVLFSLSRTLITFDKATTGIIYIIKMRKIQMYLYELFEPLCSVRKSQPRNPSHCTSVTFINKI